MIAGVNVKVYRSPTVTIGMRQHVAVRSLSASSKRMTRLTATVLLTGFVVVFSLSQFVHRQIVRTAGQVEQLQSARFIVESEHIKLLAEREQLAAKSAIVQYAAERLKLQAPEKRQIQHI